MEKHFNKLTPAQDERLAILAEECAEVIQIIAKIQRHGYDSYNPFDENKTTNLELLCKEIGHVKNAILMLTSKSDIPEIPIHMAMIEKAKNIKQYLHHQ